MLLPSRKARQVISSPSHLTLYIYTSLPGQLPGYNCNKKLFGGYDCNKKLYTAQGRLNPVIMPKSWKLLLITMKVSNHTKAHTYKCSVQSASTLCGFGRVHKALKRRILPSIMLQSMHASQQRTVLRSRAR